MMHDDQDSEKHSVYVEKYDRVYEEGQFAMNGDTLVICVAQDVFDTVGPAKFGAQMGYVTFIGLGLSVICLSIHILASFLTSELQNLSGKNLLSLSCSLWGGYIAFIAAMFSKEAAGTSYCKVLASMMYFCFMASFSWMLVISFDVARTLKLATSQLRLQVRTPLEYQYSEYLNTQYFPVTGGLSMEEVCPLLNLWMGSSISFHHCGNSN